ncbi:HAD family hydrolase [Streptosporangium sp. NBC_01495]|uniref:HAD family hydrolase n=1 Tax=Streptosporangium sp. NBC_01495 TaxID=2903899 RepID=UPI002E327B7C|nr:HAD family hydrolase [Streptosporangium sp. NBC_01495]
MKGWLAVDYGTTLTDPTSPVDPRLGMRLVCPQAGAALVDVHAMDYGLVLASNTGTTPPRQDRQAALREAGVLELFSGIACSADLLVAKPDPRFYRVVLALAGAEPAQVTFVGNNLEKDVLAPMSHGMRAVWVNPAPRDEQLALLPPGVPVIAHLRELPALLA